jgi:hypothetical protein
MDCQFSEDFFNSNDTIKFTNIPTPAPKTSACAISLLYLDIQGVIIWKLQDEMLFTLEFEWIDPYAGACVGHFLWEKGIMPSFSANT